MNPQPKRSAYRNKKITQAAKGEDCALQWKYCNGNPETTVAAHLNELWAGKGGGQKSDDVPIFMCSSCHADYDQGRMNSHLEKDWYLLRGLYRTIRILLDKGILQ